MTSPAFEMPAIPAGWDGSSLHLIRIIDPLGDAIAWFAPEHGACCAGYAVREASTTAPSQTVWHNIVIGSTSTPTVATGEHDDDATDSRWRFVERDPASCTMDWPLDRGARAEYRRLTAALTDARLSLVLLVHNTGTEPIQTSARMTIALSSPPRIVNHVADDPSRPGPDDDARQRNRGRRIVLAVDADPGPDTVETEVLRQQTRCTISGHRLDDSLSVIQPGAFRRLSVLIGP